MALPKPVRPEYSTTIPSTGKKIKYQPFTVREEKVLILAAESQDLDEIGNAISNVLSNCISSPADLKVEDLALFDIEYLFLKARAKSVGETVTVRITDPEDGYSTTKDIKVDQIKVQKTEGHTDLIEVNETTKIKMSYPGLSFFAEGLKLDDVSDSLETVAKCVQTLVIDDEEYHRADLTSEEIVEWLEGLQNGDLAKIMEFFSTMPKLKHTIKCKNPNTGNDFSVDLEGLADFF